MDLASVLGTVLAIVGVIGGQLLEGGSLGQIAQLTAALIVVGGTLGATLLAYPLDDVMRAFGLIPSVYFNLSLDLRPKIEEIIRIATIARKEGLLAMEPHRKTIQDPLFRKTIKFVIDGFEPAAIRELMETEIQITLEKEESAAQVFEGAGGYAPTIGILGAVLGLIRVMTLLNDPSKIGEGIAVAFVATIYGVALANLLFLPWANKLKNNANQKMLSYEVIKIGVMGILDGANPNFLKEKLELYAASEK